MATSEKGDAEALTGVIIDKLTSAGLSTDKIRVRFMMAHHSCLAGMVVCRNCSKTSWIVTYNIFTALITNFIWF